MHIVIAGGTGLIGSALHAALIADGHTCTLLSRSAQTGRALAPDAPADADAPAAAATGRTTVAHWDPQHGDIDASALAGADAVVNLAGHTIASRWSSAVKQQIRDSRIDATSLLARTLASLPPEARPRLLVNGSAVGFYGIHREGDLSEEATGGDGFLAEVCREWEAACAPAQQAGVRTVCLRTGVVLSARGGALKKMLPLFKNGLGGPVGDGRQWMSWVALEDLIGLIRFCLVNDAVSGPLNATSPEPVTNADFAATLGRVLQRPAAVSAPAIALRLAYGQMAEETLLSSVRAIPAKALHCGYRFTFPSLQAALMHCFEQAKKA